MSPPPLATRWAGSMPSPEHFKARSRSELEVIPMAWRSMSRASKSMSASGARPRLPSSILDSFQVIGQWLTEDHPNEMLLARGGKLLYVANANRNTVTVIDTEAGQAAGNDRHRDRSQGPAGLHAGIDRPLFR